MEVEGNPVLHKQCAESFVRYCIDKFGWRDLTSDVVMDVGCGVEGFCGMAILDKFPDVRGIVGIDNNWDTVNDFKPKASTKMGCEYADIEISDTLRNYEGKMTKVVSTHVIHQLAEKEEAFTNMFRILKPGGEAAVLFVVKALVDDWTQEMIKTPKWKSYYVHPDFVISHKGKAHYKEMVERIGFQVIHCKEVETTSPYPSRERCKETVYSMSATEFEVPPELLEEFKEEGLQALLRLSGKDTKGRLSYTQTELSILLKKPA